MKKLLLLVVCFMVASMQPQGPQELIRQFNLAEQALKRTPNERTAQAVMDIYQRIQSSPYAAGGHKLFAQQKLAILQNEFPQAFRGKAETPQAKKIQQEIDEVKDRNEHLRNAANYITGSARLGYIDDLDQINEDLLMDAIILLQTGDFADAQKVVDAAKDIQDQLDRAAESGKKGDQKQATEEEKVAKLLAQLKMAEADLLAKDNQILKAESDFQKNPTADKMHEIIGLFKDVQDALNKYKNLGPSIITRLKGKITGKAPLYLNQALIDDVQVTLNTKKTAINEYRDKVEQRAKKELTTQQGQSEKKLKDTSTIQWRSWFDIGRQLLTVDQIKEWKDELADYEKTMEQVYGPETFKKIIRL